LQYQTFRTSDFLVSLVDIPTGEKPRNLSIGEITAKLGGKAYGFLLLLFGLPNLLPIPGLPILCGLVLLFIGWQLMMRSPVLWLPSMLSEKEVSRQKLAGIIHKAFPLIVKLENLSRSRLGFMATDEMMRIIGIIVVALAISLIIVPIPFVGSMPQGLAVVFLGLGMVERDGLIISIGLVLAAVAASVVSAIGFYFIKGFGLLF
jgi:hypothetical protein